MVDPFKQYSSNGYNGSSASSIRSIEYYDISAKAAILLKHVFETIPQITDATVRKFVERFCSAFLEVTEGRMNEERQEIYLPALQCILPDDGSVLIQWAMKGISIGFSFEKVIEASSWYLINLNESEYDHSSGILNEKTMYKRIYAAIELAAVNS